MAKGKNPKERNHLNDFINEINILSTVPIEIEDTSEIHKTRNLKKVNFKFNKIDNSLDQLKNTKQKYESILVKNKSTLKRLGKKKPKKHTITKIVNKIIKQGNTETTKIYHYDRNIGLIGDKNSI